MSTLASPITTRFGVRVFQYEWTTRRDPCHDKLSHFIGLTAMYLLLTYGEVSGEFAVRRIILCKPTAQIWDDADLVT